MTTLDTLKKDYTLEEIEIILNHFLKDQHYPMINVFHKQSDDGGDVTYTTSVFQINGTNIFVKSKFETDSYGGGEYLVSKTLVKPTTKEITEYE